MIILTYIFLHWEVYTFNHYLICPQKLHTILTATLTQNKCTTPKHDISLTNLPTESKHIACDRIASLTDRTKACFCWI